MRRHGWANLGAGRMPPFGEHPRIGERVSSAQCEVPFLVINYRASAIDEQPQLPTLRLARRPVKKKGAAESAFFVASQAVDAAPSSGCKFSASKVKYFAKYS